MYVYILKEKMAEKWVLPQPKQKQNVQIKQMLWIIIHLIGNV